MVVPGYESRDQGRLRRYVEKRDKHEGRRSPQFSTLAGVPPKPNRLAAQVPQKRRHVDAVTSVQVRTTRDDRADSEGGFISDIAVGLPTA